MLFKLATLQFLYCIIISVEAIHSDYASSWWDYPSCDECPDTLAEIGSLVKGTLFNIDAASYRLCGLNRPTKKSCLEVKDLVLSVIGTISNELFPHLKSNASRSLSCSHLLGICADHLRAMFSSITDTLFTDVVHTMIHLKFNQRMFALVKANVFYFEGMAPTMMTQHGRELMAKEKERHRSALIRLLTKDVQDLDVGMDLVMQTEQLMGCIESTAIFFDREVQYLDFLGLPIVKKNMFIECHIRKIPDIDD